MRKKKNEEGKKDNKNGKKTKKFSLVKVILLTIVILGIFAAAGISTVSYTHIRAHETPLQISVSVFCL